MKSKYTKLDKTYENQSSKRERFFISDAVRGSMIYPEMGIQGGMPIPCPLPEDSPVREPSPLNTVDRCMTYFYY